VLITVGLYRTIEGLVQGDYDNNDIPIPRAKYEENGYKPDFDALPTEAEYRSLIEESRKREAEQAEGSCDKK
jgi:hypothetical protein